MAQNDKISVTQLNSKTKVLGMGTILVDHMIVLDRTISIGEKHEVQTSSYQVGGPVPTGLALLKKYNIDCHFFGTWGFDNHGQFIQSHLDKLKIHSTRSRRKYDVETGFAHVWVDKETGDRTVSAYRGNSEPSVNLIKEFHSDTNHVLYLDGWPSKQSIEAGALARSNNWPVFMDLGSPKPNLNEVIRSATWLNCPKSFLKRAWGIENIKEGAEKILSIGPEEVTITDGENGAWFYSGSKSFHQPAANIKAVDTNGAGDVFSATTLFSRIRGQSPEEMMKFASTVAGLKCLKKGNVKAIPNLDIACRMMQKFPDINS